MSTGSDIFRFAPCPMCCGERSCVIGYSNRFNCISDLNDVFEVTGNWQPIDMDVDVVQCCGTVTWRWDGSSWSPLSAAYIKCTNGCIPNPPSFLGTRVGQTTSTRCAPGLKTSQSEWEWNGSNWTLLTDYCTQGVPDQYSRGDSSSNTCDQKCSPEPPSYDGSVEGEKVWVDCPKWRLLEADSNSKLMLKPISGSLPTVNFVLSVNVWSGVKEGDEIFLYFDNGAKWVKFTVGRRGTELEGLHGRVPTDYSRYGKAELFFDGELVSGPVYIINMCEDYFGETLNPGSLPSPSQLRVCVTQAPNGQVFIGSQVHQSNNAQERLSAYGEISSGIAGVGTGNLTNPIRLNDFLLEMHRGLIGPDGTELPCEYCGTQWDGRYPCHSASVSSVTVTKGNVLEGNYKSLWCYNSTPHLVLSPNNGIELEIEFRFASNYEPLVVYMGVTNYTGWEEFYYDAGKVPAIASSDDGIAVGGNSALYGNCCESVYVEIYNHTREQWEKPPWFNKDTGMQHLTDNTIECHDDGGVGDAVWFGITRDHVSESLLKVKLSSDVINNQARVTLIEAHAGWNRSDNPPDQIEVHITCTGFYSDLSGTYFLDRVGDSLYWVSPSFRGTHANRLYRLRYMRRPCPGDYTVSPATPVGQNPVLQLEYSVGVWISAVVWSNGYVEHDSECESFEDVVVTWLSSTFFGDGFVTCYSPASIYFNY